ncbi:MULTISPECIES: DUF2130 domain-containing protein [unclassified Bradyrhizobium]|uniref:DUF2130 domain-containing protein n=1 Tax=unclassified Bradyrhizobium TaxID=2631580 RepID=UPI0023056643|nr:MULTISPECIES: DUF2130 domain-containing protein [unclassified Bradyrhizobium]MDA9451297.1 hypothetical protein [Bradyrhizobium sp. CCBAU 21360]MDA9457676.1 hypothetical protein [Bradyrhizobium sp. CCBAU 21359]
MNFKAAVPEAHDATLKCPNCNYPIRLTESLAAPLIEETRKQFQKQLVEKDDEVAQKLDLLRQERDDVAKARQEVEEQVRKRLDSERSSIISAEAKKARDAAAAELRAKEAEAVELRRSLQINDAKLAEAQRDHAELLRKQRELDEARRELELTIERRVQGSVEELRTKAKQEANEAARLRLMEREQTIDSMARTIEDLKRKAEQGSQQSQGEALELDLQNLLATRFPADLIEAIGKGEAGADLVQHVNGAIAQRAGSIMWETKRTKAWSDGWLAKLRDDQRRSGADVALIVSQALPKNVEHFDFIDGVWVTHPRCALPVAIALRQSLLEVSGSRLVQQGQKTKVEQIYQYLTGTRFRQRVEAVVEKFNDMRDDLDKERKFVTRLWAKRETQIVSVIESTVGLVGDLQAIAGKAMPDIALLDLPDMVANDELSDFFDGGQSADEARERR